MFGVLTMENIKIPYPLFDALLKYFISDTDKKHIYEHFIVEQLFEKTEKMVNRIEYRQKYLKKQFFNFVSYMF